MGSRRGDSSPSGGQAQPARVAKLDPQLERGIRGAQELGLVNAHRLVKVADHGKGGFADADNADLLRFDQFHLAGR